MGQSGSGAGIVLSTQPQHDDAGVVFRRIALDIGKVQIQRDQSTVLKATDLNDTWITRTSECLLEHRVRFVADGEKPRRL